MDGALGLVQSFEVDGVRFVAGEPAVPFAGAPDRVTVLVANGPSVTAEWLGQTLDIFSRDDVFRVAFLMGVLFMSAHGVDLEVTEAARQLLRSKGTTWIETVGTSDDLRPGPYVARQGSLTPVWRLYDDVQGAFLHSILPGPEGRFAKLLAEGDRLQTTAVAVPSRLGYHQNPGSWDPERPLSGLRIAVKDIFEIADVRTSVCNKAYYELYPPPEKTAACIERLAAAGAVIVGTTKLASFAATEEPVECVDFQAPWNPRADGYQSPAGSSSGSGVAAASYEWLDITIGSDTSGSGRRPGHWNGCFAMRPTHGVLPAEGYIASFRQFDVPTFFGRDLNLCKTFAEGWYGADLGTLVKQRAPAIIYPTDYMSLITNEDQKQVIDSFVKDLEATLGVAHQRISFEELWDDHPPSEAEGLSLKEYMKDASRNSFFYDDYHNFGKFRNDYFDKFNKKPYISPPVRWQWDLASKITAEERDVAVERLAVYKRWFLEHVMQEGERDTLVLIPIENISPRYRDEPLPTRFNPVAVPMLFVSPILGAPELTIPIGHSPFLSKVTGKEEKLPIAISILGSPGRDLELFDIALDTLLENGRPVAVKAGTSEMF